MATAKQSISVTLDADILQWVKQSSENNERSVSYTINSLLHFAKEQIANGQS